VTRIKKGVVKLPFPNLVASKINGKWHCPMVGEGCSSM
jgi:hypothetical protein